MKKRLIFTYFVMAVLVYQNASATPSSAFTRVQVQDDEIQEPTASDLMVPLNAFFETGSGWSMSEVKKRLLEAQSYYYQNCGILLHPIYLTYGDSADVREFQSWRLDENFAYLNSRLGEIFVVFAGKESELGRTGYAWEFDSFSQGRKLFNTVFIFRSTITFERTYMIPYKVLVHELAHILLNYRNHNQIPNNIFGNNYDGMDISPQQCDRIRSNISNGIFDAI